MAKNWGDLLPSSSDSSEDDHDLEGRLPTSRVQPDPSLPKKRRKIDYASLTTHGYKGGEALKLAATDLAHKEKLEKAALQRKKEKEEQLKKAEREAEDAAFQKSLLPNGGAKMWGPAADLSEMPKVVTQAERRGELLRAQADAVMSVKFESGQAQDVSFYTGAVAKQKDARKQARERPNP